MEPKRHIQDEGTFQSLCGVGYPWPSSIAFARGDQEVTCKLCIEMAEGIGALQEGQ